MPAPGDCSWRRYWAYRYAPVAPYPGCAVLYTLLIALIVIWLLVLLL